MLKAVVSDDTFDWGDDRPPNVPWSDTVIYEAHVRGYDDAAERYSRGRTRHVCGPGRSGDYRYLRISALPRSS